MMEREFWKQRECDREVYRREENDLYVVYCLGVIVYLEDDVINTDILKIADCIARNRMDFNKLYGFYRIVVYEKETEKYFFWGDNAGSQKFFIDEYKQTFSDSLLALRKKRGTDIEPCCSAIAALIEDKGAFTNETVIMGIHFTETERLYMYHHGHIRSTSKKLLPLFQNKGKSLKQIMDILLEAIGDDPIAAVCTGGTDSRVVLAHLYYARKKLKLIITGRKNNPDIPIAKRIAHRLQLPLTVYNSEDKEKDWLEKGYIFSDGIYDPILSYRHLRKLDWAKKNDLFYEFGGNGGECAKNYYLHYPSLKRYGRVTVEFVMKNQMSRLMNSPAWAGEKLKEGYKDYQNKAKHIIHEELEPDKFRTMNRIGMRVIGAGSLLVANNMAFGCIKIDPFMERDFLAEICQHSQWECSLHKWHRKQIQMYCPQLSLILTDTGYSFSMNPIWLLRDFLKRGYLMCRNGMEQGINIIKRIFKLDAIKNSSHEEGYWDKDALDARQSDSFARALKQCKRLGVVSQAVPLMDIPPSALGTLYMVGRMFSNEDINGNI